MPHMDLRTEYVLTLTPAEFRLVGLALSGRLRDSKDILAARELNIPLLEISVRHGAERQQAVERNLEVAREVVAEEEQS